MRSNSLKEHQTAIVWAAVASAAAWAVPYLGLILLPLQYLNTHAHELGHALATVLTGGEADFIHVYANGSGVTHVRGGSLLLISAAGYIGAAALGAALIYYGRTPKGSKVMLRVMAIVLMVALLLWIRGDLFGVISAVGWAGLLWWMSASLSPRSSILAAQFLGLQQCLQATQSLFTLLHISAFSTTHSDAMNMQAATGVPALFWAVAWAVFSLVVVFVSLKAAWKHPLPAQA